MTHRAYTALLVTVVVLGLVAGSCSAVSNRAVSLKVLQSVVRAGPSQQASTLCGITFLTGYVIDRPGGDIILTGKVDPSLPALYLDDFVVALRNAGMAYARKIGRVRYYESPGCSIDPNPDTIRALESVGDRLSSEPDEQRRELIAEECKAVGARPQNVRVMGVPFDSRFAKVMVDADYYMKRLVDGSVDLGIPGLESMWDARVKAFQAEMRSGASELRVRSLNRFWFCPGRTTFEEQDGAVILRDAEVVLRTEEEYMAQNGRLAGMGRPDPLAKTFTESFTAKYGEIAAARPIYRQLQALFRSVGIAKLIRDNRALAAAGLDLDYLLRSYRVQSVGVNRAVRGLTRVQELTDEYQDGDQVVRSRTTLTSCGGVNMDVRPVKIKPSPTRAPTPPARPALPGPTSPTGQTSQTSPSKIAPRSHTHKAAVAVSGVRHKVVAARKTKNALFWDYGE